jgi:hypothetical protein
LKAHHRHRARGATLWLAAVVVLLFCSSLAAIILFLHHIAQLALEMAGHMMNAGP